MSNVLKLKRTSVPGRLPTTGSLVMGELAVNTYDGKLFIKKNVGGVESIATFQSSYNLNDLSDVDTSSSSLGSLLTYNGSQWRPTNLVAGNGVTLSTNPSTGAITINTSSVENLEDLSNVVITDPSVGQVLKWNGTNWVNDTDITDPNQADTGDDFIYALIFG